MAQPHGTAVDRTQLARPDERLHLSLDPRGRQVDRAAEVRAQPDDLQPLDLAHLVEEHRHLRERYAEASEAGVRLDVHGQRAHRAAQALGEDLRHLEVAHHGRQPVVEDRLDLVGDESTEHQHFRGGRRRRRESPRPLDGGHAERLDALLLQHAHDFGDAVTVGVGFDHGHQRHAVLHAPLYLSQVPAQRGAVDLGDGRGP